MELIVIQSTKHLRTYKEEWDAILRDADNRFPFLEYPFFSSWWNTFGRSQNMVVYAVKEFGRVIAFFPFQVERTASLTTFRFLEDPTQLYKGFIIRKRDMARVFMYFFDELMKRERKSTFQLDGFIDKEQVAILSDYLQARNIKMEKRRLDIAEISSSALPYLTYIPLKEKVYLESIGDIEIVKAGLDRVYSLLPSDELSFYRKVAEERSDVLHAHIWTLLHGKEEIACYLGFSCRGRFVGYKSFWKEEYKLFNPERVLLSECLQLLASEATYLTVEDSNVPFVVSNYEQNSIHTVRFSSKKVFLWLSSSLPNSKPLEANISVSSSPKLLLARLSNNKLQAQKSYKRLEKEDFLTLKSSKKYTLQKIAEGFEGFYSKQPEWCFWVNPTEIVLGNVKQSLEEHAVFLMDWENEDLEKVISFVQNYYNPKYIYLSINRKDREVKKKLKLFGFQLNPM